MHKQRDTVLPLDLPPGETKLTYKQLCLLPDDGKRYEIIAGDLYVSPSPSTVHQRIVLRLAMLLHQHATRHGLGEVFVAPLDVLLSEHDVVEPDIVFVSTARAAIVTEKNLVGAPDLVVEVLSPTTSQRDLELKRASYARGGIPWYWIVDPRSRVLLALQLEAGQFSQESETSGAGVFKPRLFPGLDVRLAELWD